MIAREKVIKEFEHLLIAAKGNYQDFVDLTVDGGEEILALLKEQDDALEQMRLDNEDLRKCYADLLKEQEAIKPTWNRGKPFCGVCGLRIHGGKFCGECGKPILWEGRRWNGSDWV